MSLFICLNSYCFHKIQLKVNENVMIFTYHLIANRFVKIIDVLN